MVLDATAREANVRDSIKKYFVDNLETIEGLVVTFDKALSRPDLSDRSVDRWVAVDYGAMIFSSMSDVLLNVHCVARGDNEGFKLAQLKDKVMGYLTDTSTTDGFRRITFYQSAPLMANWSQIGSILVTEIIDSPELEADDETKYKTLTCRLRFASKV